jgi:hypothetical protein
MPTAKPVAKPTRAAQPARARKVEPEIKTGMPILGGGYTMMPYDFDHLVKGNKFSDGEPKFKGLLQMSLIYMIARRTWGTAERPEYWKVSVRQLAAECGAEARNVAIDLADAKARGMLTWPEREGCRQNAPKMYRLTPEGWFRAPKYVAPAPAVVEKAAAAAEEEETPETELHRTMQEEPEPAAAVVAPGKTSRPAPVSIRLKGHETPLELRVSYHNLLDFPVRLSCKAGLNGRIVVTTDKGEGKANANPPGVVVHDYTKSYNSPSVPPQKTPQPVDTPDFTAYRNYLDEKILEFWGVATDKTFQKQVYDNAGGAPLHVFQTVVNNKFPSARQVKDNKYGLLLRLAETAARTWQLMQLKAAAAPPPPPTYQPTPEEIAAARAAEEARVQALKAAAAAAALRCQGCKGTGQREHAGVKGVMLKCGLCHGTGRKAGA